MSEHASKSSKSTAQVEPQAADAPMPKAPKLDERGDVGDYNVPAKIVRIEPGLKKTRMYLHYDAIKHYIGPTDSGYVKGVFDSYFQVVEKPAPGRLVVETFDRLPANMLQEHKDAMLNSERHDTPAKKPVTGRIVGKSMVKGPGSPIKLLIALGTAQGVFKGMMGKVVGVKDGEFEVSDVTDATCTSTINARMEDLQGNNKVVISPRED